VSCLPPSHLTLPREPIAEPVAPGDPLVSPIGAIAPMDGGLTAPPTTSCIAGSAPLGRPADDCGIADASSGQAPGASVTELPPSQSLTTMRIRSVGFGLLARPRLTAMVAFAIVVAAVAAWGTPRVFAGGLLCAPRTHAAAATDTVAVAGPFQFSKQGGGPNATVSFAFFTSTADTGRRYLVRTERVSGTLSSVDVRVNGMVVATTSEVQSPGGATRIVHLPPSDTIWAAVAGSNGATIQVTVVSVLDPSFALHHPWHEASGTSLTSVGVLSGYAGPFHLHWMNGPGGTTRVGGASVDINGTRVLSYGCFSGPPCNLPSDHIHSAGGVIELSNLVVGDNEVFLKTVATSSGNPGFATFWITATDTARPIIEIWTPTPNEPIAEDSVTVHGRIVEYTPRELTISVTAGSLSYSAPVILAGFELTARVPLLAEGENTIKVHVADRAGFTADSTRVVRRDTQSPSFDVLQPTQGLITRDATTLAHGPITDASPVTVTANGVPLDNDGPGFFDDIIPLAVGVNEFTFVATDAAGNTATINRTVVRDTTAPALTVSAPVDNAIVSDEAVDVAGTVTDGTALTVTVNGTPITPNGSGAFSTPFALAPGGNVITVVATDAAGNTSTVVRNVTRLTEPVPPDPAAVAPPLDRTVATAMAAATEFLYTGANPIQTGVASGTIDPKRAAVLRGTVKKRDGTALPGVAITILDHSEFGRTLTRADGTFDIAVNGGGLLTVNYRKTGFLQVQRQVQATLQGFEQLDDVVLIQLDTASTAVDFNLPIDVHRGSLMTDGDGSRRATLLFQEGTQATMTFSNGTTQPLSSVTVRATEYSVGETGPLSLPAPLPGTAAHTYALELSVDEAIAGGATGVEFSKPVVAYVENFLKLPVGLRLPLAFADQKKGTWVPMANGTIIKIVGITEGRANISVDTAGTVADSATLEALGITIAELEALATTYTVDQTLWRLSTTHFTALGVFCPAGPPQPAPAPVVLPANFQAQRPPCEVGSIIECTTQVLGEFIPVTGAPFSLSYRSLRTPGYLTAFRRKIHLTGDTISPHLLGVELRVTVAGRRFDYTFPASPNQSMEFAWDGLDAYGRRVQGKQPLTATIWYVYPMLYEVPAEEAASFGLTCYGPAGFPFTSACFIPRELAQTPCKCRSEVKLVRDFQMMIGELDADAQRMGGWTASVHHTYDPVARVLYLGSGERREARDVLTTVAGTGGLGTSGDGGPATQAQLFDPNGIALAPDGAVFVADISRRIRRIAPDGIITTFAGMGQFGYTPDGVPAVQANLAISAFTDLAFGPDGTLYFTEPTNRLVRKIGADGILRTAAGDRALSPICGEDWRDGHATRCSGIGDGGLATQAALSPLAIAVGPDGSLYVAEAKHLVRKVNTAGIITTIAGGGFASFPCDYGDAGSPWASVPNCGDGESARNAGFGAPWDLAVGPDGSVYVTESGNESVRVISPDGIVRRIAGDGTGLDGFSGDGGPATSARMSGEGGIELGPDGSIYLHQPRRIRRISPQGIITTIAGTGAFAPQCGTVTTPSCTTDQLAAQAPINTDGRNNGMAIGPDGSIYFGTYQGDHRIRRIVPFFRSYTATGIAIASEDGAEVYEFDATGRHLRTRDALTKRILLAFTYDAAGRLTAVTDADGNVTTLERNATGNLTAVVSPFGKRTAVTLDAHGYLATVTTPAGEMITTEHDTLGLLRTIRDAKNNPPKQFAYDSVGRLTRDTWPSGGFKALTRTATDTSVSVSVTSALGRIKSYLQLRAPDGTDRRVDVGPAGLTTVTDELPNGTTVVRAPNSTIVTLTETPGPRFGMQAPVASQFSLRLPSGLQLNGSNFRKATLANMNDPLSVTSQTDSLVVNGRTFRSVFDASAGTLTQTSAEGRQTVTQLDTLGRVVEERIAGAAPVRYDYGPRGLLMTVTQAGRVLRYDYDSAGRVKRVTDPLGRFEQYAYDSAGRVVKQTLFNGSEILYSYDANGNLTSLTPPGRPSHTFAYTADNLDSVYTPPAAGLANPATRYTSNLDRQLTRVLRPDSLAIDIAYDTAGRPRSLTLPNGQVQFAYSPTSENLTTLTAADGGTLTYTYDGSLPTSATWAGTVQGSVGVKYDTDFRVSKVAVNGTDSVAFGYDKDNLLTSAGALVLARDPQNGRLTRAVLSSDTSFWTYDDSTGALSRYTAKHAGTMLFDVVYLRDSLDRITQIVETVQGVSTTKGFTYDSLGRLDQVRLGGVLVSDYGYDANGNRTSLTPQAGMVSATHDDQDRMLTYAGAQYVYTSAGELKAKIVGSDTTHYAYDALGNLVQVRQPDGTVIDYLVDVQNRRIGKKVNGLLTRGFLYADQIAPVAELDENNSVVSWFVFATRPNVPDYIVRGNAIYRVVTDHLGSVRLVIDVATGTVVQRINYDEYGRILENTNPEFQPFGYAGGVLDEATGFHRFGARDYDSESGRWTTKDPLGFRSGVTNLYAYVRGDPIGRTDPSGLVDCCNKAARVVNDALTFAYLDHLRRTHLPEMDLGTMRPQQPFDQQSLFGIPMSSILGPSITIEEPTRIRVSLDADLNVLVKGYGKIQYHLPGLPDAIITEFGFNVCTGTFAFTGNLNNFPLFTSIGGIGNAFAKTGQAGATLFGIYTRHVDIFPER
jgi:RHS repeat-associated protein